jgi:nucleoside-diphosphate-sugar epimerase
MKILVTGGSGFLGQRLIRALVERGELQRGGQSQAITLITALDAVLSGKEFQHPGVRYLQGDLADRAVAAAAMQPGADSVFHLAAVVSGAAEADFDLGMRVNVDGTRGLLDACRALAQAPTFVFASSVAVFGGALPDTVEDSHTPAPQSSYGVQKLIGELLVGDYSRRAFIDGRAVRLPTIVVRPGKPNAAASSFASGIIREPLAGVEATCPVSAETRLWVMSPARAVTGLIHAHETRAETWGLQRALSLPGLTVSVHEMIDALRRVGGEAAARRVRFVDDERIAKIVATWPARFNAARAQALGFGGDANIDTIVRTYADESAR